MSGTVAVTVTKDQILDGMLTAIGSIVAPSSGVTDAAYVRKAGRFMGRLDPYNEAFQRGITGRCPAVVFGFDGEHTLKTTIGRRVDRVEGTYLAACISDSERGRDDRKRLLAVLEDVRLLVAARRYSLQIQPVRYHGTRVLIDTEKMLAVAAVFTTRYRVDYTKHATYDVMEDASGDIFFVHDTVPDPENPPKVDLSRTFPEE